MQLSSSLLCLFPLPLSQPSISDLIFLKNPNGGINALGTDRPLSPPPRPPSPPKIRCRSCGSNLQYMPSESTRFVQCRCGGITEIETNAQRPVMATVARVVSQPTATAARPITLGVVRPAMSQRVLCVICGTVNSVPLGVALVRCGACGTVSDISHVASVR